MARARDRKTRDFNQVKCIKDEREQLLVKEDEIRHRWQEYFNKLFNGENENTTVQLDDSFDDTDRHFVRRIQESEVREALKRMKGGKAMGPDGICRVSVLGIPGRRKLMAMNANLLEWSRAYFDLALP